MLEKVKHENIVKLLAIEEEQEGRGKVKLKKSEKKKTIKKVEVGRSGDVMDCMQPAWRKPKARKQNKTWLWPGIHSELN